MAPFYESLCNETGWTVDSDLLSQLKKANDEKLASLEEAIEDSKKNFGETEQKDALQAKAEYLCRIGCKVCAITHTHTHTLPPPPPPISTHTST